MSIFRAYDIRGIVDTDLNETFVENLGRAIGTLFVQQGQTSAVLARDCRLSSPAYAAAILRGLLSCGVDVINLGMVPSPCMYYGVKHLQKKAGVMVTASHNPSEYNGFKVWLGEGTLFEDGIQAIRHTMESQNFHQAKQPGIASNHDILPEYLEDITKRLLETGPLPHAYSVVVDGGNGAAGKICATLLRNLGADVVELYCEPDGNFPNHHPDPVVEKNARFLRQAIQDTHADFGFGLDGDGDRLGVIDAQGRLFFGDELVAIFARDILARNPGAGILGDVKCSERLFADIRSMGGHALMCRTGHSLVKAKMRETNALLAGELSGHIFHAENWYGFDDAVYSAARLYALLCRLAPFGQRLESMPLGWPQAFSTPELNIPCPEDQKKPLITAIQALFLARYGQEAVDTLDGMRWHYPGGFALVRASNTSPQLVLRFEAASKEELESKKVEVLQEIEAWQSCNPA